MLHNIKKDLFGFKIFLPTYLLKISLTFRQHLARKLNEKIISENFPSNCHIPYYHQLGKKCYYRSSCPAAIDAHSTVKTIKMIYKMAPERRQTFPASEECKFITTRFFYSIKKMRSRA